MRTLQGGEDHDTNALIGRLALAVRKHPNDPRGWALLGQAYATAHDPGRRRQGLRPRHRSGAGAGPALSRFLYSAYGEALTQASAGAVTPRPRRPSTRPSRSIPRTRPRASISGLAAAARGNCAQGASLYWKSLLADVPANSALHADLVDRIAQLTARSGGAAPDISAMVAGLAARLKANPDDMRQGWQRLVRAYSVLGETDKARAGALADAQKGGTGAARATRRARCRSESARALESAAGSRVACAPGMIRCADQLFACLARNFAQSSSVSSTTIVM